VEAAGKLRVNNSFAVRGAAVHGLGIAQFPPAVARDALQAGLPTRALPAWQPPAAPAHAVFPETRYLTPKVRAFIDHAVDGFDTVREDRSAAVRP
jgi:LysR family transcriptional regulator for bpeEF and oprC